MKFIVFIVALSSFITALGQSRQDNNIIIWSKNHKLTWNDFQGVPNNNKDGAVTTSAIKSNFSFKNGIIKGNTSTIFYKNKSWVKNGQMDSLGLVHEQGHFDISEIYARKYRKTLLHTKFNKRNIKKKINEIYSRLNSQLSQYQDLYDKETNFHRNKAEQIKWVKIITQELQSLKAYSNPILKIKYKTTPWWHFW